MKTPVHSCSHLMKKRDAILSRYALLVKRIVFPMSPHDISVKASLVHCADCSSRLSPLMCCCFECAAFGCLKHIRLHLQNKSHMLAVSTNFGEIFCLKCNDFVYDRRVEKLRRDAQNSLRRRLGFSLKYEWNPGKTETKLFRKSGLQVIRMGLNSTRGLRGLVNMGNTCFMNCIIQTLLHIPMLRDYFLSDQHNCQCQALAFNEQNKCLMCELAHIFQEFYGGEIVPYVPHKMLHLVWTHAKHLAGYEQHDAHEFLISALNVLHKHSESISMKVNPHECKCIIDRLFTGQMQSDLTCTRCGRVSTTVDPYWDISLELLNGPKRAAGANCLETPVVKQRTLDECLDNFVKPENLGCNSKIKCDNCGTYEESTKQLTLRKLPIVACFHLKRFEHTVSARRQKIKDPVKYPEFIDLTPYTTTYRNVTKSMSSEPENESSSLRHLSRLTNRYSLIAVVNHNGTTESGHYSCFIRHQRHHWYV
ncbi:ubiquitin carboxyl-terminal hydrolase domain-containing protein [Ditylenchus destructor]|nr:ubiquitin carboxyl-terminal hydrolase domain-containing protein [Ditylenchus destructor]